MTGSSKGVVVVGMNEGVDSLVAAYLLKKQGYECIGVTVVYFDNYGEDDESVLLGRCHVKNLEQLKQNCNDLGITFYAANAVKEFKARVLDRVVESRLVGEEFSPCQLCNKIKIRTLIEKAKTLKADYVATGHYAKVTYNKKYDEYQLVAATDIKHDQSHMVSTLGQAELKNLLFPLAEITKKRVDEIAAQLGLTYKRKKPAHGGCLSRHPNLDKYIEVNVPFTLRKSGSIYRLEDDSHQGEHDGTHTFYIGKNNIVSIGMNSIDSKLRVRKIDQFTGSVYIADPSQFLSDYCTLKGFVHFYKMNVAKPLMGYAKSDLYDEFLPCLIIFKNNDVVFVQFQKKIDGLVRGHNLTLYMKNTAGAKVVGAGEIFDLGIFRSMNRIQTEEEEAEEDSHLTAGEKEKKDAERKKQDDFVF